MSVLVYIEVDEGAVKKSSLDAIAYASKIGEVVGVAVGNIENSELEKIGNYGCTSVLKVNQDFSIQGTAEAIAQAFQTIGAKIIVLGKSSLGDAVAGRLAIKLNASLAQNVIELIQGNTVKTSIYSSKAFATISLNKENKILVVKKGAVDVEEKGGMASVSDLTVNYTDGVAKKGVSKASGDILLPEADLVVSAGRGLKGPENWGMIEELAKTLGAATACSKPVSDMDWRPHSEHVGQTGIKVSPNLYIAIGISGAIQHLAGVNSSKTIVVINTDAEAPFFKSADYGIVGDAFEVVPKLIQALK